MLNSSACNSYIGAVAKPAYLAESSPIIYPRIPLTFLHSTPLCFFEVYTSINVGRVRQHKDKSSWPTRYNRIFRLLPRLLDVSCSPKSINFSLAQHHLLHQMFENTLVLPNMCVRA